MQEQLIELYTARLAKEKNYNNISNSYYSKNGEILKGDEFWTTTNSELVNDLECVAPTQSILQKFLRENYNIHIHVEPVWNDDLLTVHHYDSHIVTPIVTANVYTEKEFETYESALEDALQSSLEII